MHCLFSLKSPTMSLFILSFRSFWQKKRKERDVLSVVLCTVKQLKRVSLEDN